MLNGTLRIRRVERSSAGVYTCQASSTEGSTTHATQLLVLGAVSGEGWETGCTREGTGLWLGVHTAWGADLGLRQGPWRGRELPVPLKPASCL